MRKFTDIDSIFTKSVRVNIPIISQLYVIECISCRFAWLPGVVESDSPSETINLEFQIITYNYNLESTQYDFSGVLGGRGWFRHEVDKG